MERGCYSTIFIFLFIYLFNTQLISPCNVSLSLNNKWKERQRPYNETYWTDPVTSDTKNAILHTWENAETTTMVEGIMDTLPSDNFNLL